MGTIAGQHQGVFGIPGCPGESMELCNIMRELLHIGAYVDLVQNTLVQAQYWHDPIHNDEYLEKSQFIADINNERSMKNETSHFEFYAPGQDKEIVPLRESPIYLEDWIGLRTLDEAGKLILLEIPGDHLQVSTEWLISEIIQKYFV